MKKRILAVTLLTILIVLNALPVVAFARWSYIDILTSGLSISGGVATCTGSVAPSDSSYSSSISIVLKRKEGSSWVTYAGPWSSTGTGYAGASIKKTANVVSGYSYKVVATGKIKSGSKTLETASLDSSIKSY